MHTIKIEIIRFCITFDVLLGESLDFSYKLVFVTTCLVSRMSKKNKILVVEDNDFVRMQLCNFVKEVGFSCEECTDGGSALEKINDEDIALALVDVRMEPVDGFEFIRTIRGREIDTPVFLVTGDDNLDLLSEASRLGVTTVLKKPVQKDRLIKMLERTLQIEKVVS